jgi:hypothetical protein
VILVDTGVVVAMGNRRDDDHDRCTELLTTTLEPLVLPEPLLVEIGYMLGSRAGARAEADFLRDVADACVIALAERLGVTRVATLDTRHFSVVRPRHVPAFTLLP